MTDENNNFEDNPVVDETVEAEITNKDLLDALNKLPENLAKALFCYNVKCDCKDNKDDTEQPSSSMTDDDLYKVRETLVGKIQTAEFNYLDAIEYLKQFLIINDCYSANDIVLVIGLDKKDDLVLTIKLRPFAYIGKCIQLFYDCFGEPNAFISSNHHMRIIMEYKLS